MADQPTAENSVKQRTKPIIPKSMDNLIPNHPPKKQYEQHYKQQGIQQTNQNEIRCATWNIMHGLIKRELEITQLLQDENIDILFLTETDTVHLEKEEDFKIKGFSTIFPKRVSNKHKIRIICLMRERVSTLNPY